MLNGKDVYVEAGRRCARAVNERDEGRAKFERDWLARALRLESPDGAKAARQAFDDGYKAARNINPFGGGL